MLKALIIKEFLLVCRDRHALAALFIMPAVFILIMSMALKDTFNESRSLVDYAVVDQDNTPQSAALAAWLASDKGLTLVCLPPAADRQKALAGETDFILEIPQGFSAAMFQNPRPHAGKLKLHAAADVRLEMVKLLQARLLRGLSRLAITNLNNELADYLPDEAMAMIRDRTARFNDDAGGFIELNYNTQADGLRPTSTQQSVPSWIVFGMFFVIIPLSTIFINERQQNTLMRMRAMHVSTPALFVGKLLPYMLINQLQVILMIAVGMFVVPLFGAEALTLGNSLGALFMVSLGLSLSAIGFAVLIAVSAQTIEQATTIGGIINILLGAIGGVMVPKFYMPEVMQRLAELSPMAWGLDGFLDIFLRGLGAGAVVAAASKLAGLGLLLLLLAGFIFERRIAT